MIDSFTCDTTTGKCDCKLNRVGLNCELCAPGFFLVNALGIDCFRCNCDPIGSIPGSTCDPKTGECVW